MDLVRFGEIQKFIYHLQILFLYFQAKILIVHCYFLRYKLLVGIHVYRIHTSDSRNKYIHKLNQFSQKILILLFLIYQIKYVN